MAKLSTLHHIADFLIAIYKDSSDCRPSTRGSVEDLIVDNDSHYIIILLSDGRRIPVEASGDITIFEIVARVNNACLEALT